MTDIRRPSRFGLRRGQSSSGSAKGWVIGIFAVVVIAWIIVATWSHEGRNARQTASQPLPASRELSESSSQPGVTAPAPAPAAQPAVRQPPQATTPTVGTADSVSGTIAPSPAPQGATGQPVVVDAANPEALDSLVGSEVELRGYVWDFISSRALTVTSGTGREEVLVLPTDEDYKKWLEKGSAVQIFGTVERFDPARLSRMTGVEINEKEFRDWIGKVVIVASKVDPLQAIPR